MQTNLTQNSHTSQNFAELHLHIEGTLEPDFLLSLASRNRIDLPTKNLDELKKLYNFSNLSDFLKLYYKSMQTLKTSDDYFELANRYFARVDKTGLTKVEAFFDPQTHAQNGNSIKTVLDGLVSAFENAQNEFNIDAKLIMCFERDRGVDVAKETLENLLELFENNPRFRETVIGVGMDSVEVGFPPAPFKDVYETARKNGLNLTAHAGEEAGPEFIWESLDILGVSRIDHGVRAIEDSALIKRLATEQIPLTCCPLSNYALKGMPTIEKSIQRIIDLLEKGVLVTINSDDPAYFGGYIDDNFREIKNCGFTDDVILQLKQNSLKAAWTK